MIALTPGKKTWWRSDQKDQEVEGGIYFVGAGGAMTKKADLDPDRYKQLFLDLITGERKAIVCAMPLEAGEQIVHALDRFWSAVQAHGPWQPYKLEEFDCFR